MPKNVQTYHTIALILHASKVVLKILQTRFQQYMNQELPDVQAIFRKSRGTRDQIVWILGKAREFQKNIYFCFTDHTEAFDCVSSAQLSHSVVSDSATPWTAARQASLSITNSQSLLKLMSID